METYLGTGAPLSDYIPELWEHNVQGYLGTNLQNNPYCPFVMREECNSIQCGIKKNGIKTYYDNVLKKEKTTLHLRSFKNGEHIHKLVCGISDHEPFGEWELHTLEDMRWNDNHQCSINCWSQDMIKSMR